MLKDIKPAFLSEMKLFREKFQTPGKSEIEVIGMVTRCHLVLEAYLIQHLEFFNPSLSLEKLNLDFSKLLKLAIDLKHSASLIEVFGEPAWALNTIRRDLVHRLGTDLGSHPEYKKIQKFVSSCSSNNEISGASDPLQVVDMFTVLAVTFISLSKLLKGQLDEADTKVQKGKFQKEVLDQLFSKVVE